LRFSSSYYLYLVDYSIVKTHSLDSSSFGFIHPLLSDRFFTWPTPTDKKARLLFEVELHLTCFTH
jgi:hypothetical protein